MCKIAKHMTWESEAVSISNSCGLVGADVYRERSCADNTAWAVHTLQGSLWLMLVRSWGWISTPAVSGGPSKDTSSTSYFQNLVLCTARLHCGINWSPVEWQWVICFKSALLIQARWQAPLNDMPKLFSPIKS